MHNMANPYIGVLSGMPISVASGEGPFIPMVWPGAPVPRQQPVIDIAFPILRYLREMPGFRGPQHMR